jgi:menaquinone-dependent protoporphyrinogen oxidase
MKNRILITYATRTGTTIVVAAVIGEILRSRGFSIDLKAVKKRPLVEGYDAVIIGSAIHRGNWLPEAVEFVKNNQAKLSQIPTAIFTVQMWHRGDREARRQARAAYTASVWRMLTPVEEVSFKGNMNFSKLTFFDPVMVKTMEGQTKEGDFRDWNKIRRWAQIIFA